MAGLHLIGSGVGEGACHVACIPVLVVVGDVWVGVGLQLDVVAQFPTRGTTVSLEPTTIPLLLLLLLLQGVCAHALLPLSVGEALPPSITSGNIATSTKYQEIFMCLNGSARSSLV